MNKQGWEGGKTKATWADGTNTVGETERWSCECWHDRIHLKRSTPVEKKFRWQSRCSRRICIPIGIWEHLLGKVWNQHLTLKQLEYHNSKQNKGLACKISRNKHMIEISSEFFWWGPHGPDHTAPSCTRQCTWHTKRPRVSIAEDSLRHNETTEKTNRG